MKKMTKIFVAVAMLATSLLAMADNEPFITKVYDFLPAPGQFVNTLPVCNAGETSVDVLKRAETALCGYYDDGDMIYKPGMVSLGSYGGYVVFGFDHPVVNVAGDYDLQIFGNSFAGSSEPGIVMVSYDTNGNGLPDDAWYELAGSEYSSAKTQHNFTITYYKPAASTDAIRWTSNDAIADSTSGTVDRNSFHQQSYWPLWAEGETLTFTGTKLCNNAYDTSGQGTYWVQTARAWGYVDNLKDYDPYSGTEYDAATMNRGFKLDWAVDEKGTPVVLPKVHFVKVYNAMNQMCGWLGETSTEVAGAIDFHPQAEAVETAGDANADGKVDVSDVTTVINLILGQNAVKYNPVAADANADTKVDVSDVTTVINLILN